MTAHQQIGESIRRIREYRGLSQTQLGELIGSDGQRISKIEQGKVNITLKTLIALAQALNCILDVNLTQAKE